MDAQAFMPVFHLKSAHGAGLAGMARRFIKSSPKGVLAILERFRSDRLVDTGQIDPGTALRLFAVAPLRLITTPCSKANLPRSRLSQSGRKRSSGVLIGSSPMDKNLFFRRNDLSKESYQVAW